MTLITRKHSKLITVFYLCLMITFILGSIYSGVNLLGGFSKFFPGRDYNFYFLQNLQVDFISIFFFLIYCLVIFLMCFYLCKNQIKKNSLCCFLITFLSHLLLLLIFRNVSFFSDFQFAWERSLGDLSSLNRYQFFPSYVNYSLYLKILIKLFGESRVIVILINIILNSLTSVGVYLLGYKIYQREIPAFFSSLLYSLYLPSIFYTLVATPEHITVLFNVWGIYLLSNFLSSDFSKKNYFYIGFSCVCFGIADSMKTFFPIIFIAFILIFAHMLYERKYLSCSHRIFLLLCTVFTVFMLTNMVSGGILKITEKNFDIDLNKVDATPHFFAVGLNRPGEGQIHLGNFSRVYLNDRMNSVPRDEAVTKIKKIILDDWSNNLSDILPFIVKKTIWAWQDDCIPITYFLTTEGIQPNTEIQKFFFNGITRVGSKVSEILYFVLFFTCIYVCVLLIRTQKFNYILVFSSLIIEGYFFLMFFSEAQSRYKCLIMPFIFLLLGYLPYCFIKKIKK